MDQIFYAAETLRRQDPEVAWLANLRKTGTYLGLAAKSITTPAWADIEDRPVNNTVCEIGYVCVPWRA